MCVIAGFCQESSKELNHHFENSSGDTLAIELEESQESDG